ncbi:MAG: site-specific DNA-methyltransferase [Bacteroidales bacterium]|nr:site-specific DNA-methyltransferase [Bacteroidales bacterium]
MGKIDRAALRQKIQQLEGLSDDERAALLELAATKRYGLVWEEREEAVEERLREELPVLVEDKDLALLDGGKEAPNHILIEGDNLEALTTLSYTHEGKVDVIYIDPPYNTGNKDFVYNDSFVDSEDSYRHSKWLSFMNKRLRIAKRLLSDRGVIFISIDDNEQAQLKILCDEIFGVNNFINCVSIKAKSSSGASGGGEDKKLKKNIEYLLIYAKFADSLDLKFPIAETPLYELIKEKEEQGITWSYTNVMTDFGSKRYIASTTAGNGEEIKIYQVDNYVIESVSSLANRLNKSEEDIYNEYIDKIFTTENAQTSIRQRVANAVDGDGLYIAEYIPVSGRNKGKVTEVGFIGTTKRLVSYLKNTCVIKNEKVFKKEKIGTLWADLSWSAVSKEGNIAFPAGKKPISLIERVIDMIPKTDAVVLDFFAGSGSTGHATMSLNSKDNGKRVAILITNNENNICIEKTYPRCCNVINGYNRTPGLKSNNLRYYRTHLLPRECTNRNMRRLVAASTDLLCIKENIFDEIQVSGFKFHARDARLFTDGERAMMVIYNEEVIPEVVEWMGGSDGANGFIGRNGKIKVYVFSPGAYAWDDDFAEVIDKVELCALPEAIYQAYKSVLPKKRVRRETAEGAPKEGGEE